VQDAPLSEIAHLAIPADASYLSICRLALAGVASDLPIGEDALEDLKFALSEACGNAIRHGYPDGPGIVEVAFRVSEGELEIAVSDQGRGFAPHLRGDRDEAGLGIGLSMIRTLSSRWRVESGPDGEGTVVTFARSLPA
jgi:anti-sigma regulatory factor (Ser/Thr protein kinase)